MSLYAKRRRGMWIEDLTEMRSAPPFGPRNTYSNIAYPLAGLVPILFGFSVPALVFLGTMAWLGYGSWQYHSEKTPEANYLDWSGMFAVFFALATYCLIPWHPDVEVIMVLAAVGGGAVLPVLWRAGNANMLIGLLLTLCLVPALFNGDPALALGSMTTFGVGKWTWNNPSFGKWGHAIWHVLTAVALALMFLAATP